MSSQIKNPKQIKKEPFPVQPDKDMMLKTRESILFHENKEFIMILNVISKGIRDFYKKMKSNINNTKSIINVIYEKANETEKEISKQKIDGLDTITSIMNKNIRQLSVYMDMFELSCDDFFSDSKGSFKRLKEIKENKENKENHIHFLKNRNENENDLDTRLLNVYSANSRIKLENAYKINLTKESKHNKSNPNPNQFNTLLNTVDTYNTVSTQKISDIFQNISKQNVSNSNNQIKLNISSSCVLSKTRQDAKMKEIQLKDKFSKLISKSKSNLYEKDDEKKINYEDRNNENINKKIKNEVTNRFVSRNVKSDMISNITSKTKESLIRINNINSIRIVDNKPNSINHHQYNTHVCNEASFEIAMCKNKVYLIDNYISINFCNNNKEKTGKCDSSYCRQSAFSIESNKNNFSRRKIYLIDYKSSIYIDYKPSKYIPEEKHILFPEVLFSFSLFAHEQNKKKEYFHYFLQIYNQLNNELLDSNPIDNKKIQEFDDTDYLYDIILYKIEEYKDYILRINKKLNELTKEISNNRLNDKQQQSFIQINENNPLSISFEKELEKYNEIYEGKAEKNKGDYDIDNSQVEIHINEEVFKGEGNENKKNDEKNILRLLNMKKSDYIQIIDKDPNQNAQVNQVNIEANEEFGNENEEIRTLLDQLKEIKNELRETRKERDKFINKYNSCVSTQFGSTNNEIITMLGTMFEKLFEEIELTVKVKDICSLIFKILNYSSEEIAFMITKKSSQSNQKQGKVSGTVKRNKEGSFFNVFSTK